MKVKLFRFWRARQRLLKRELRQAGRLTVFEAVKLTTRPGRDKYIPNIERFRSLLREAAL